jgi:erythromycin esterase
MRRKTTAAPVLALALALLLGACAGEGPTQPPPPPPSPPLTGLPDLPESQVAWLKQVAAPMTTTLPNDDFTDLEPLRSIIGDARIVALGEATHGTAEFFTMKHRLLRFLVTRMGFNAFAIEATWPEGNRLDAYVRTGMGAPDTLLSGLYFWTWNTAEVRQQIDWMRGYNATGGSLGFYGFDMQYPGMALENVRRYVLMVDPASEVEFAGYVECLRAYANDSRGAFTRGQYASQSTGYRADCRANLLAARQTLQTRKPQYVAASSAEEFAIAVRSVELALQYHAGSESLLARDSSMAANADWLLEQLGPTAKIVLWAHNYHVSSVPGAMGQYLRQRHGTSYIRIGFLFGKGSFNAVPWSFATGQVTGPLRAHFAGAIQPNSYEHYFSSAGMPMLLLDVRARQAGGDSAQWLPGPRLHRTIGAAYESGAEHRFWTNHDLPSEFDVVIYLQQTNPSVLLPFRYPAGF